MTILVVYLVTFIWCLSTLILLRAKEFGFISIEDLIFYLLLALTPIVNFAIAIESTVKLITSSKAFDTKINKFLKSRIWEKK